MKFFWNGVRNQQDSEKIDYSNLSNDELLNTFRSQSWSNLDENHRIAVFQEMENRSAAVQGRETAMIVSLNEPGLHGSYTSGSNQIQIDVTNDSSYESLDTYLHESNHAYQTYCIEARVGDYDEHTRNMMQAEMARDERGSLYNYQRDSIGYDMQCNELDSNNRAIAFILSNKELFSADPEYREYIESRANHFSRVNNYLEQYGNQRAAMQSDQAYTAYVRGDISENQYATINRNLYSNKEHFIDVPAEECGQLNKAIAALSQEYHNEQSVSVTNDYLGYLSNEDGQENRADVNEYIGDLYGIPMEESVFSTNEYGFDEFLSEEAKSQAADKNDYLGYLGDENGRSGVANVSEYIDDAYYLPVDMDSVSTEQDSIGATSIEEMSSQDIDMSSDME